MGRTLIARYLPSLDLVHATDTEIHDLCGTIAQACKTSPLVLASPQMQASAAAIATKDGDLTAASKLVADDRGKLRTDVSAEAVSRISLLGELRAYATFATNGATSDADLHAAGLAALGARPAKGTPPAVPTQIDTKFPKTGHGKATVIVHETGPTRHHYAAQESLDGITWTQLGVSHGKTRVVTGASGAKIWVRFAMVRGQLISDWSAPVLDNLP